MPDKIQPLEEKLTKALTACTGKKLMEGSGEHIQTHKVGMVLIKKPIWFLLMQIPIQIRKGIRSGNYSIGMAFIRKIWIKGEKIQ